MSTMTATIETIASLSVVLRVSNVPSQDKPELGHHMSNGTVIESSNQYDYITRYERHAGECDLINVDAKFNALEGNSLIITKQFDDMSEDEALRWMSELSTILLMDTEGV